MPTAIQTQDNNKTTYAGISPRNGTVQWLYFITARGNPSSAEAAPVLDSLVVHWLAQQADIRLRQGRTADYTRYISLLETWGNPYQLAPAQVEERIFRIIRSDGTSQPTDDLS